MESLPFFSGHCAQDEFLRTGHLRIARAFHEVGLDSQDEGAPQNSRKQKPQEGKPRILEGLRQVTKAAHFFAKQNQAKFNEDVRKPLYLASMDVFHPVLIVDSELFEAHLKEDGEMDIQSQPWMPVEITYSSPLYREGPWGNSYFPDIVTLSAWPDYLSRVEQWRLAMIAKMNEEISHQRNLPPRPRNRIVIKSKASEGTTFTGR